jgi:primosomal protein N' (replication factor Y)
LRAGRQALVLLPEIALTSGFVSRFTKRFGTRPGEWHSDMSPPMRTRTWRAVLNGDVRVVLGARSALFLPFRELGLIVLDEEHDGAYKQSDGVNYHARDMAVLRAKFADARVILSSATPSVESRNNANTGRYRHIRLTSRFAQAALPEIAPIDMREEPPEKGQWIAPRLAREIFATLDRGEQALLFLNRRGYAPLTLCKSCGHQYQCPDCSAWLVEHRFRGVLMCHHCGHEVRTPKVCTACGADDSLVPIGPGIERVAEEAAARFPDARTVILSSDMGSNLQLREKFEGIERGDYDLVIGTQLVAKGHHFEKLTLVGVLDADLGLDKGDPRAAERTFQILTQVTGRAGRAGRAGKAYLQTYHPGHAVMQAMVKGDREAFYAHELLSREAGGLPPFGRLAALIVSAAEHDPAMAFAKSLLSAAPMAEGLKLFGPADAPIAMIRGRHRVRLLAQSGKDFDLSGYVRFWLANGPKATGNLRVQVDIDPQSFL